MVSDGSWMVRVQAAKTLGSMLQVSPHFLEQTLDKKLMSDLRFSSGRKWADDAPKEKLDTNTVNLIASGACGAFVHGLEDEMFEVRIAAVEALCQLARSSASFAEKCLDFLVDMFNDEIEEVRLQSIHVLREISTHITLREDQLDTVLAVLEDSSRDIREALHELICYTNVSTKECIQLALLELLKNLNKYPTDRNSVWKCLKFLGSRHPTLVLPLVPELLSTHPYFDTPEPDMDDPACILKISKTQSKYIAVLVLVFNAAKSCPTMPALFSDHTFRHYAYLRDKSAQLFLQQSLNRVSTIQNLEAPGAQDLLNFTIRLDPLISSCEKFLQGIESFQRLFAAELPHLQDSFVDKLLELMPRLSSCKPAEMVKILLATLRLSGLLQLRLPEQIHRATATIIEPTGESDNPLRFTTGLVVALDIDATLEHVLYPDGQSHVIHPKPSDFRKPGPDRHRLITQVYLSHTAWTGGVEDPPHLGALAGQFVVFSNGLLRLQDSDVDTFLHHKVQSGGGNLREEMAAKKEKYSFAHASADDQQVDSLLQHLLQSQARLPPGQTLQSL
ncbi:hypothetical protein FQN60_016812 [Etheostoma spectabile]|uniref:Integrator complex subunit 4 n=1 Tax=Etheostoma spectabile TaxID=54343 RepID=A0A5J5CC78_9PERO|nr:hypothetical protein FQN60_016812 [Etheostoma spectabile]